MTKGLIINSYFPSQHFCHLHHLSAYFLAGIANNMDPDQTAPKGTV